MNADYDRVETAIRFIGQNVRRQPTLDEVASRIDAVDMSQCREAAGYFAPEGLATFELSPT